VSILIGGVSQLFQGDLDLGRRAVERLQAEPELPPRAHVEDLYYGAVAIAQLLEELRPTALLLIGAESRGRAPGTVERRRIGDLDLEASEVQVAVGDSVTGYVGIDLVVEVAWGLGLLPERTIALEVEPATTGPGTQLSALGERALDRVVDLARAEARRAPLLDLADDVRAELSGHGMDDSEALAATEELLAALHVLDREGRWGRAFAARDRLRLAISEGRLSEGMTALDWGLWWTLIEELDRLQAQEGSAEEPVE
jgi:hypothetical protein